MTDEQLDPRDAEVRRLLAGARHTDPVPEDVAARLDRVLADLATEPSRVRPVTDLATRRRRVTRLLVAAAAVVVVGVGVQQVVSPRGGSDGGDGLSTTSLREEGGDNQDTGSSEFGAATSDEMSDDQAPEAAESSPLDGVIATLPQSDEADLVRLRPRHFADDVAAHPTFGNARGARVGGRAMAFDAAGVACRADAWGRGTFVPVRYGRTPAVLVFRRAMGDTQVADLFLCGDTEPERSVTLPAP